MEAIIMIILDKQTTFISPDAKIAEDVIIYPNNHIIGNTVIGKGCKIMPNCILKIGRAHV